MTLALLLGLACSVHAEQADPAPSAQAMLDVHRGIDQMKAIEATVASLTPVQLEEARKAAKTLTTTCPYNGASLQLMGTLIDQVPADSATREGVDSMARMLAQLELDGGTHSVDETRMRLDQVDPAVQELTEEQSAIIEASGDQLRMYTGAAWPPKGTYASWNTQLRAEGHAELASLIDLALENRC